MEPRRKKRRVLSSSESDSSPEDDPSSQSRKGSHISGYDSDGNSSVESMDIIMYPSASVLSKIENSKSREPHKSKTEKNTKSTVSAKKPKNKNNFNKKFNKLSKDLSTIQIESSELAHKNEVRRNSVNDVTSDKTKSNNIKLIIRKECKTTKLLKTSSTNTEINTVCKKPRLHQHVSIKEEESLPNGYEESDTATCSYFEEKMPDMNQTKKSTVKKRPENYGSRLNSLLSDFKSHENNKSQSSEERKQRPTKPKDKKQIKHKEIEKKSKSETYSQNSKSQSAKNVSCTESLPEAGKEEQSSTELLHSKDLNNDETQRSSNFYNLSQIPKEGITSNLENSNSDRQFHETVSQPCNSVESLYNNPSESDRINVNMPSNYSLNLIKIIVDLDTQWSKEKEKNKNTLPPLELLDTRKIQKLPPFFKSFDDYYHNYLSMIKLEAWEKVCLSTKANLSHTNKNNFTFSIDSHERYPVGNRGHLMLLECKSAVHVPTENSLVIVNLKLEDDQIKSTFGFIVQLECKNKDLSKTNERHHKVPVKQLVFKMFVKSRVKVPQINCQMEGKFVCDLYKETKQAEALNLMQSSPLLEDFLKPSWDTFCPRYKQCCTADFFDVQQNISDVVSQEINSSTPKILLLQGPPGSGKTSAIVSVASNLLRKKKHQTKILISAPSHFALDQIGKELIKLNEQLVNPINFVRLGQIGNIHKKLLDYSMCKYLEKFRISYKHNYRSVNSHLKTVNEMTLSEQTDKPCNEKSKKLAEKREVIKNKEISKDHAEQQQTGKILSDTSLILAVPEDCWELRKFKVKFTCCLIDEVNQGTELDTLYPFALEISKFLLVADPMQLPANVQSETARNCGYQRSVMERFQSYFKKITEDKKDPTIVLSQQFRINSRTAYFPLKQFYSDYSISCTYADKRSGFFPFREFLVINDRLPYGTESLPYTKETGVNFIRSLCDIIDKHDTSSIGIIVPSEEDKRAIEDNFPSPNIVVETVDHFQGREKTIIILSLYHDFKKDVPFRTDYFRDVRKLNVALTRAISSLIICGPLHETTKCRIWSNLVTYSKNQGCYFEFKSRDEVNAKNVDTWLFRPR